MSIRPIQQNADGSIAVIHDELGHTGTIPAAEIQWGTAFDMSPDHNFITLICPEPGCGSVSTHPVGGGAAPVEVQQMFVAKVDRDGCVCPMGKAASKMASEHVHELVTAMDGPERWALG